MTPSGLSSDPIHVVTDSGGTATITTAQQIAGNPTTQTNVAASTTSAALLAANSAATYRLIVNPSDGVAVTVKLGSGTVTDRSGIYMPAGSEWDGYIGNRFYRGDLAVKTLTGASTLSVIEG